MARKTLSDFNYDYQAYADYLESAECANDDGYEIYGDRNGNVYTPTGGDWTKGHGHKNENTNYDRKPNISDSKGRPWKNPWLKYEDKLNLSDEEIQLLTSLYGNSLFDLKNNELNKQKRTLSKRKQKIGY